MRVLDVAVHAWDLARAIAADEHLDPLLVDFVLAIAMDADLSGGSFAAPVSELPNNSSIQTRLLHIMGRPIS